MGRRRQEARPTVPIRPAPPAIMPETILQIAENRDDAIRLSSRRFGFIL
jgi:hypothetical protein